MSNPFVAFAQSGRDDNDQDAAQTNPFAFGAAPALPPADAQDASGVAPFGTLGHDASPQVLSFDAPPQLEFGAAAHGADSATASEHKQPAASIAEVGASSFDFGDAGSSTLLGLP